MRYEFGDYCQLKHKKTQILRNVKTNFFVKMEIFLIKIKLNNPYYGLL